MNDANVTAKNEVIIATNSSVFTVVRCGTAERVSWLLSQPDPKFKRVLRLLHAEREYRLITEMHLIDRLLRPRLRQLRTINNSLRATHLTFISSAGAPDLLKAANGGGHRTCLVSNKNFQNFDKNKKIRNNQKSASSARQRSRARRGALRRVQRQLRLEVRSFVIDVLSLFRVARFDANLSPVEPHDSLGIAVAEAEVASALASEADVDTFGEILFEMIIHFEKWRNSTTSQWGLSVWSPVGHRMKKKKKKKKKKKYSALI
eukprot:Selendium_serpulae@DN2284_c0_g1_i1.p1